MKKALLLFAGLTMCGSVFAEDVLLVNTDSDSKQMTVAYEICDMTAEGFKNCQSGTDVVLKGKNYPGLGSVFKRIALPANKALVVTTVTSSFEHQASMRASFPKDKKACTADMDTVAITLDTKETDTILCGNGGKIGTVSSRG